MCGDILKNKVATHKGEKDIMAVNVDIKALFEAGVHFGHKTSRWHPKMAKYIFSKRQDTHIIDLDKTVEGLDQALAFITKTVASGRSILFVGTKKQMKEVVREAATSVKQPYVTERWIGGTLTNVVTINKQLRKLHDLERRMKSGELEKRYSKFEVQKFQEQIDLLNTRYGGIKDMKGRPGAIFAIDMLTEANAIKEARTLGIPVIAIADTNVNPELADYVIPGNDDAIKGVALILDYVAKAVSEGLGLAKKDSDKKEEKKPIKK
jgi:ribosomal protein S2